MHVDAYIYTFYSGGYVAGCTWKKTCSGTFLGTALGQALPGHKKRHHKKSKVQKAKNKEPLFQ